MDNPKVFGDIRKLLLHVLQESSEGMEEEEDLTDTEVMERSFEEALEEEEAVRGEAEQSVDNIAGEDPEVSEVSNENDGDEDDG